MDEESIRKKSITLNILGMGLVIVGWLVGGIIGSFLFIIGTGLVVGVVGGKIVRAVVYKSDFQKGIITIFVYSIIVGVVFWFFFYPIAGVILALLVLIVIGIYNSDMKEALENYKP